LKTNKLLTLVALIFATCVVVAQSPVSRGTIITPANTAVNPLDPNGDGAVYKTSSGFSNDGDYADEFEFKMFGIPKLGGEVAGDNQTEASCGVTDLIPDTHGYSVYAVRDAGNNLIFRFRLGNNADREASWHILLDIDGLLGQGKDPDANYDNPGFEVDITLIKKQNLGIILSNINGKSNCPTPFKSYSLATNFQVAVADLVSCGDPDYFYDFFVPFSDIAAEFGISANTGLRYAASTSSTATCAVSGFVSDIAGIDNKDPKYDDQSKCNTAYADLIGSQCPTPVASLCETCSGFNSGLPEPPTITGPIRAGQTVVGGTSKVGTFIKLSAYTRNGGSNASPTWSSTARSEITVAVQPDGTWLITFNSALLPYDKLVAKAQLTQDGSGCDANATSTITVTVVNPNAAPVAQPQTVMVTEDTPKEIAFVAADSDAGDVLTYAVQTIPLHGTLSCTNCQNPTYTPAPNYSGPDSFTFLASDGAKNSSLVTVTINVQPVNDPPVADNARVTVIVDKPKTITLLGSDADGDALSYIIVTQPINGTLSGSGSKLTYTPKKSYEGSDFFTYKVNDGTVDSNIATVFITCSCTPGNDAPIAKNQTVTVIEDNSMAVLLDAIDADGDALTFFIVTPPKHGTLSGTGANLIYVPNPNFHGPDSFTFRANDGKSNSNLATVSITCSPVNDAPIAIDSNVTIFEDVPTPITLSGTDVDGDALSYIIVTQPLYGTLSGTGANLIYTPNFNFTGSDSFTFKVNDGTVDSNTATVSISVVEFNDPPVANNQSVSTNEDVSLVIILTGSDPDGDEITYSIVNGPTHGTLSGSGSMVTYLPDPNYYGPDSFTFKVNDGSNNSNVATVSITVNPVNDAPVAFNLIVPYEVNTPENFTIRGTDIELGNLTAASHFIILTQPSNGTLTGTSPNLIYTPNPNFNGTDKFTFKVNDGSLDSDIATVTFVLDNMLNDAPVAINQNIIVFEDQSKNITLQAVDADADPIVFTIITTPSHGTLSGTAPNLVYTPSPGYIGPDTFTFRASDGSLSSIGTVTITVVPVNDAPIALSQTVSVLEDTAEPITLSYSDADGNTITYTVLTQPSHGVLSGTSPNLVYTPNPNYYGTDSFTFKVNDGTKDSNIATVFINVVPVNDAPVAVNDLVSTLEDVAVTFNVMNGSDTDVDGPINPASIDLDPTTSPEEKTFVVAGQGTYTVDNTGNVTFTPAANYYGTTTPISYTVKDDVGSLSNVATIQVVVTPVNDSPVVTPITITTNEDVPVTICLTVTDIENDPSLFTGGISLGRNSTLTADPASGPVCFIYTPNMDYNGTDQVEVTVCDANDPTVCSTGVVTVNVLPVNDPPKIVREGIAVDRVDYTTPEDTPLDFCFDVVEPEGGQVSMGAIANVTGGGTLVPGISSANKLCFTFTPLPDFNGVSTWSITLCDDSSPALCATFTIKIDVTPVNDDPVVVDQTVTLVEDTPTSITLSGTDVDGDALTYTIVGNPQNGVVTITDGVATYTPNPNYVGNDSFTYTANDGTVDSNVATVSITITPVNDAPVISPIAELTTPEDTPVEICLGVTEAEEDPIVYQSPVNVSGGGTMTPSASFDFCYTFLPAQDFNGIAEWKFTVCDTGNPSACSVVTVTINVTPVNDPPVAVNDFITAQSITEITPVNILDNDFDVDGDDLVLTTVPVAGPYHGTVTMNADGTFTYTSNSGYIGADSVRYKVCDTGMPSLCDEGVVFIDVQPPPFKIYTGYSPNGDGLNDYWRIDGIESFPNNRVRIFDRYNNMIFEAQGYNNEQNSWQGQANHSMIRGNLPDGTYYYIVDLGNDSGLYSGYVVLRRN